MRVLFVCWHGAARSLMAEAFFSRAVGTRHVALSAGTHPATSVHPLVLEAMLEVGIALRDRPSPLTPVLAREADVIVRCLAPDPDDFAWPSGPRFIDWQFAMPAEDRPTLEEIRQLRDQIASRVGELRSMLD